MNKIRKLEDRFDRWFDSWFDRLSEDNQFLVAVSPLLIMAFVLAASALIWGG